MTSCRQVLDILCLLLYSVGATVDTAAACNEQPLSTSTVVVLQGLLYLMLEKQYAPFSCVEPDPQMRLALLLLWHVLTPLHQIPHAGKGCAVNTKTQDWCLDMNTIAKPVASDSSLIAEMFGLQAARKLMHDHGKEDANPRDEFKALLASGVLSPAMHQFLTSTLGILRLYCS